MTGAAPVLAEVVRSGWVESRHRGDVIALRPDGAVAIALGDVSTPMFPRSCNKPLQLAAMLTAGLDLDEEELAVAAASHNGEDMHVQLVRRILRDHGLTTDDLDNTPGLPLSEPAAWTLLRAGGGPDAVHQNCSGKHAAMLATCVRNDWPTATYLEPAHPLQQRIRDHIADLAGEPVARTAVDGCGAPLFAVSLRGLAQAFRRLALAVPGTPEHRVAAAMRAHPDIVGGEGRDVTALMRAVPGLVAKDGAEGAVAFATADGAAAAVKVEDGAGRARLPVAIAVLAALGVEPAPPLPAPPVLGHGRPVGEVRAVVTFVT